MSTLVESVNKALGTPNFAPGVYTIITEIGAAAFMRVSGCSNLAYGSARGKYPLFVRLDLPPNKGNFTRLKIYLTDPEYVSMCFYKHEQLTAGNELVWDERMLHPIEYHQIATVFEIETGIYMKWVDLTKPNTDNQEPDAGGWGPDVPPPSGLF